MKNAIILAAGKSNRFAPFTYEKPKGLFKVKGEVLIERQIKQLKEAGIQDIYIVIGFMKEKFFYLEKKFGVNLIINNTFAVNKGNLYSLYAAKDVLKDSYICCADQYFYSNPFVEEVHNSYRSVQYLQGKFREFAVTVSDANVITSMSVGGSDSLAMIGHAYFNDGFSKRFIELMETEINDFGVANMFWEEFYARHQEDLTLFARIYATTDILEFDSVEELRKFDQGFLMNIDSAIVGNICSVLSCEPNDIASIEVIQKGLTNVSFKFFVKGVNYVYRHPGGTSGNLVNRDAERYAQYQAKKLGIDKSVIYMDASGWKLSYYVENIVPCDFDHNDKQLKKAMYYLRVLHHAEYPDLDKVKLFDTLGEAKKLMKIASATKGDLCTEFEDLTKKAERLNSYLEADGFKKTLCHNDTYAPNYLVTSDEEMYLIDWEYAGVNDPANDLGCILCRYDFSEEQIKRYLTVYFGRELTLKEEKHFRSYIALSGFYWFCWGLYKGSVNDDDGFFFLPAYRNCIRFIDEALARYEDKQVYID